MFPFVSNAKMLRKNKLILIKIKILERKCKAIVES